MKSQYGKVYLYISREIFASFIIAFLFFFFIFFVNQLLLMAERILSKRVPLGDVLLLILYSIPIIVTYALPFGTLVGALMAIGRLSSENEILALRALGVSILRILVPLLLLGIILSLTAFVFNDIFLPLGNIRLKTMLKKVIFTNPSVELESYSVKRYEDTVIIMGEVKGKNIKGLVIIDRAGKNKKRVITASEARLEANPEQRGAISLRLENVFTHVTDPSEKGSYEYGSARSMIYNILLKDISISLVSPGPAEMSSSDVWREIETRGRQFRERLDTKEETIKKLRFALNMGVRSALQSVGETFSALSPEKEAELVRSVNELKKEEEKPVLDRSLQRYLLEFQRKFASPFSCFVFILFAYPVGLLARRSGRALGFGVGIVMSGIYWGMLLISYRFGSSMSFSPVLSMWAPNLFVMAASLILIARKVRT